MISIGAGIAIAAVWIAPNAVFLSGKYEVSGYFIILLTQLFVTVAIIGAGVI